MKSPWPTKKLGEICEEIKKEKATIGITPYIEIGNVDVNSKKVIFNEKGAVKGSIFAPENSILISRVRPTRGAVTFIDKKIAVSSAFTIIKPRPEYNPKLLFYFLAWNKKFFEYLRERQKGTNYPSVREKDILEFEISFPENEGEQQKIVKILDTIQSAVEIQERIIEKTKELKKSLANLLFHYGLAGLRVKELASSRVGELTSSEIEKLGLRLKKTEIGEIPEDWEVVRLGDENLFELIMGQSPPSSSYNQNKKGLPFLQGKAEFGEIYPQPIKWCDKPIKIAEKNDILISVRAPVGDLNLADQKYCIGRGLAAIRLKNNVDPFFLFNCLNFFKNQILTYGTGSTFKAITKEILENFKIPLPPLPEQQEIAEILETIDQKIEIEKKKKELYEELFKTMLNKIMSQEIDVEKIEI
jgi:type I restriction enzyme S subunit